MWNYDWIEIILLLHFWGMLHRRILGNIQVGQSCLLRELLLCIGLCRCSQLELMRFFLGFRLCGNNRFIVLHRTSISHRVRSRQFGEVHRIWHWLWTRNLFWSFHILQYYCSSSSILFFLGSQDIFFLNKNICTSGDDMSAGSLLVSKNVATVSVISSVEAVDCFFLVLWVIVPPSLCDACYDQDRGFFEFGWELFWEKRRAGFEFLAGSECNKYSKK